jgi:AcrR family transcriptional regulator
METTDTKSHLLDVAEHLFAEHGIDATSLRAITSQADVNLAAVHYHFGSKEGLVQAIFARRLDPLNADRLRRLDACETAAGDIPPPVEKIIEAFIHPALKRLRKNESKHFMKLMGRIYSDPSEMHEVCHNRFLVMVLVDPFSRENAPPTLAETHCDLITKETPLDHFVTFLSAGMRAPCSATASSQSQAEGVPS